MVLPFKRKASPLNPADRPVPVERMQYSDRCSHSGCAEASVFTIFAKIWAKEIPKDKRVLQNCLPMALGITACWWHKALLPEVVQHFVARYSERFTQMIQAKNGSPPDWENVGHEIMTIEDARKFEEVLGENRL